MNKWLRRIRGAIGMGLTWGAAWFGAGMIMMLGLLLTTGSTGADVPYPLGFGLIGFFGGVAFSGVLGLLEGRRTFDQMSMPRFAGWGALGGLVLSVIFVSVVSLSEGVTFLSNLVVLGPVFAVAGAGCASGVLAVARKGEDGTRLGEGVGAARFSGQEVPHQALRGVEPDTRADHAEDERREE